MTLPQAVAEAVAKAEPAPLDWITDEAAVYNGRALCSLTDPRGEAKRWAESINVIAWPGVVVAGFGLGYHIEELSKRMKGAGLIVLFEPDMSLVRAVSERLDLSWISKANIAWIMNADDRGMINAVTHTAEGLLALGSRVAHHAPGSARLGDQIGRFAANWAAAMRGARANVITALLHCDITLRNVCGNVEHYCKNPGISELADTRKGEPAVCVAAGPSLVKNIDRLKGWRGTIITVATALKPLLAAGIRPEFVTCLDYHEISARFFAGLTAADVDGITLVAEPKVNPAVTAAWPGAIRMPSDMLLRVLLDEKPEDHGAIRAGATVAHLSCYLARYMGCDPVILVGQDLGFTDYMYYGRGAAIEEVWANEVNEYRTIETLNLERILRMRGHLHEVTDIDGKPLLTDDQMQSYLTQFVRDWRQDEENGLTTIDATEGGVAKPHTRTMTLEAAIAAGGGDG